MKALLLALGMVLQGASQVAAAVAADDNLLINGSFESTSAHPYDNYIDGDPADFIRLDGGSMGIEGWTVGGLGVDWHVVDTSLNHTHFGPSGDGSLFAVDLALGGSPAGSISQTFTTQVGQKYRVSFLYGSPGFDSALDVSIGGLTLSYTQPAGDQYDFAWENVSFVFTARAAAQTLTFTSVAGGYWGPVVDAASVVAVPEPEAYAMLLAGLGVFTVIARRRGMPG